MSTTLHQSPSLQVEEPWYDPSPNPRALCRGGILQQHSVHTRVMQRGNHTRRAETLGMCRVDETWAYGWRREKVEKEMTWDERKSFAIKKDGKGLGYMLSLHYDTARPYLTTHSVRPCQQA